MSNDSQTSDGVQAQPALARTMGLPSLVLYGMGGMVGAGIYGTIGVAAGALGNAVWMSFVISMCAALLTGLSYASLGSRYPKAGGVAYVTERAYGLKILAYVVGLTVAVSGLTSMATGANVFAQTLHGLVPSLPVTAVIIGFLGLLTLVNLIGIRESMWVNILCTLIEVGGLVFVIVVGARYWGSVDYFAAPSGSELGASLLLSGAVLTFYAFIGFEDMLNVAEEVRQPERNLPRGILLALVATTVLYILISITAVSVVDSTRLANAKLGAPLAQITSVATPWLPGWVYGVITLFAVGNTALLNYIMGSRMLYGMARQGLLPTRLGAVHHKTRTPHVAILVLATLVLGMAFAGNIAQLASATSLLLLACFCVVNVALIVLKLRRGEPAGRFEVPLFVPALGALVCAALIAARLSRADADWRAPAIAIGLIGAILTLYFVRRPSSNAGHSS
ncbi:MAG: amino acid permease [Myxococcales bacterium]|nr:amino acid permease [Myxococcales bacterium]